MKRLITPTGCPDEATRLPSNPFRLSIRTRASRDAHVRGRRLPPRCVEGHQREGSARGPRHTSVPLTPEAKRSHGHGQGENLAVVAVNGGRPLGRSQGGGVMRFFFRSDRRPMRPEEVRGSLDLGAAREDALLDGIRVVGVRAQKAIEPVDVRVRKQSQTPRVAGSRFDPRRLFARVPVQLPRPAWGNHPNDPASYPAAWATSLRRFVLAFEREEAREGAGLAALGLPVPRQVSHFSIEAVGVEGWVAQFGRYGFSSLDVTPPSFELPPGVEYQGAGAAPCEGERREVAPPRARVSATGHTSGGAEGTAERPQSNRDPYAFYRQMSDGQYVYHLRERGLDVDFDRYWLMKFDPLMREQAA